MVTSTEIIAEEVKKMPSSSSSGRRPSSAASSLKMALQLTYATLVFVPYVIWSSITNLLARRKAVNGQVVLVTGAGGALGRELCLEFAKLGCAVACADIVDDETQKTVSLVKAKYPAAIVHHYHCDVTSTEDIKQMYHAVLRDVGKVDILVNNAGILRRNLIQKTDDVRLDRVIDINLKSQFKMTRQFLPDMIASNKGHVVAISSLSALCAIPGGSLYSATKHGVLGMMEALYYDLQSIPGNEVKTTCVCPYFFRNNVIHEKNVDLKVKAMSAGHVAQISVDAILKNKTVYVIPPMMYFFVMWLRIVPQKYADLLRRITVNPTSVAEKITIGP